MEQDQKDFEQPDQGFTTKRFIPELGKLPWFFKIPLFFVALFLISMPYILMHQSNPFNQAVATYDKICKYKQNQDVTSIKSLISANWDHRDLQGCINRLDCVQRRQPGWKLYIRQDPDKAYTLMLKRRDHTVMVRFSMENNRMMWLPDQSKQ